nr:MAG TPA: hypothetical protein [Caudoviricetes sp.]
MRVIVRKNEEIAWLTHLIVREKRRIVRKRGLKAA